MAEEKVAEYLLVENFQQVFLLLVAPVSRAGGTEVS